MYEREESRTYFGGRRSLKSGVSNAGVTSTYSTATGGVGSSKRTRTVSSAGVCAHGQEHAAWLWQRCPSCWQSPSVSMVMCVQSPAPMLIAPPCNMPAQPTSSEGITSACANGDSSNWRTSSSEAKYGDDDRRVMIATVLVRIAGASRSFPYAGKTDALCFDCALGCWLRCTARFACSGRLYSRRSETPRSRSALATTDTDEKLIASAASIGLSRRPNTGYSTPAATGTPSAL